MGGDDIEDLDRISAVLHELDADIIALQEVGYRAQPRDDVARYLGDTIGAATIPGITLSDEAGDYGNALLTRLQVQAVQRHDISVPGREPRGVIEARLYTGQDVVRIMATHLGLRQRERQQQLAQLLAPLERPGGDLDVLLGDFNDWFRYSRLRRRLNAALGTTTTVATFPAKHPALALDRIWARPATSVTQLAAHRSRLSAIASDHLPLVAELALPSGHT